MNTRNARLGSSTPRHGPSRERGHDPVRPPRAQISRAWFPGLLSAASASDVRRLVDSLAAGGANFIKVYNALPPDLLPHVDRTMDSRVWVRSYESGALAFHLESMELTVDVVCRPGGARWREAPYVPGMLLGARLVEGGDGGVERTPRSERQAAGL